MPVRAGTPRPNQNNTMKKSTILSILTTFVAFSYAQSPIGLENTNRTPVPKDSIFRTPAYLQNPGTTSMTVMWLTNVPSESWVEFGTDTNNLQRARTMVDGIAMANNTINRIVLRNLKPGTRYYYRVLSREITLYQPYRKEFGHTAISNWAYFTTFSDTQTDFTAIIFNDLHDRFPLIDHLYNLVKDIPHDIVFFNGDNLSDIQSQEVAVRTIRHFSRTIRADHIPSVYVRGNHEMRGAYSPFLYKELLGYVDVNNRPFGAFNIGDTRFVILDAGEDKPDEHENYYGLNNFAEYRKEQAEFLRKELASPEFQSANRRVLIHHIPAWGMIPFDWNPTNFNAGLQYWGDVLKNAPFDIALNGHTHRYAFHPKGTKDNNPYPIMVGGSSNLPQATVAILRKKGNRLNLTVLSSTGEVLLSENL